MRSRGVVPINDISRRLPEAGRLRFGVKSGRAMKAIGTWRATSHDQQAIEQIAAECGGTPKPWTDAPTPGQWEVITEADELRIVLPPNPLGGTPVYEQWSGGGCQRRCDGAQCEIVAAGQDGAEYQEVPCICLAKGAMECDPRLRLSVILPFIRFGGVWRMETKSWNAVAEIPAMVDLILSLQDRGLTRGVLALKHRKTVTAGETHRFIVPVLGVDETIDALASGHAQVGALGSPVTVGDVAGELEAGETPAPTTNGTGPEPDGDDSPGSAPDLDDVVIDAEVIDDAEPMASHDDHEILRAAIGFLPEDIRAQFLIWWKSERMPIITHDDTLTVRQYERVMNQLECVEPHDSPSTPAEHRRQARAARAAQVIAETREKLAAAE